MKSLEECRRHVDGVFRQVLPAEALEPDAEGRRWLAYGSATLIVSVGAGYVAPFVYIAAPLARGVAKTRGLLETLNRLNEDAGIGRIYWNDGLVMIEETLLAETVDVDKLMTAIFQIGRLADAQDDDLRERFGGTVAFESQRGALRLRT